MRLAAAILVAAAFCPVASNAEYVPTGAQSLLIDPSIRASGMGRASTAVFWGDDPNYWANPALLGYHHGIRYEWGKTQLVPGLADDVFFESERWTIGAFGVGVSMAGKSEGMPGELRLDYGVSEGVDEQGNPTGTFSSWEEIRSQAIGVNLVEAAENLLRLARLDPPAVSRFGDLSLGWAEKTTEVFLAPASVILDGHDFAGKVTTRDHGLVLRLTPYNSLDYEGFLPSVDRAIERLVRGVRLDMSYGDGVQNSPDTEIHYPPHAQSNPVAREEREGWAVRLAVGLPAPLDEALDGHRLDWLRRAITPLMSFGYTAERLTESAPRNNHGGRYRSKADFDGWELMLGNVWTIRRGHVDDPEGTVIGNTEGWGLGLRFSDVAGFRYDRANIPQSIHLKHDVTREGFEAWFDAVALWRAAKRM